MENKPNNRILGIDIYRIVSAFFVFLFHSQSHIGCNYGFLSPFISMGAIFMTAFFIISGFSLYLTWNNKPLNNYVSLKKFYLKRLIVIIPLYYFVSILFIFIRGKETVFQNLLLAPIEILGIQSHFSSLFGISHNGGTWFISCILTSYFIYPILQEIVNNITKFKKAIILVICIMILLLSPFVVYFFNTANIYSNPFFRFVEFFIGILICSFYLEIRDKKFYKILSSWFVVIIEFALLIISVSIAFKYNIRRGDYMFYNWFCLIFFMLLAISISGSKFPKIFDKVKIIQYLGKISYAFFLAQYFVWMSTTFIMQKFRLDSNIIKILIAFILCMLYTILLHELFEKPLTKILKKVFKI